MKEENYSYKVGKNARHNIELIKEAQPNDIWFHIEGLPSSHVVMSRIEKENDKEKEKEKDKKEWKKMLRKGAILCRDASKYTHHKGIVVIYTEIENVIPIEERVGSVRFKEEGEVKRIRL